MNARHALYAFLIAIALVGGIDGHMKFQCITPPIWWDIASSAILALFAFGWYFLDSKDHCYRRSNLLNVAVFVLAAGAIPYHLAKSHEIRITRKTGYPVYRFTGLFYRPENCP